MEKTTGRWTKFDRLGRLSPFLRAEMDAGAARALVRFEMPNGTCNGNSTCSNNGTCT